VSRSTKRPYTGSKRFDRSCRNHGSCTYCVGSRTHRHLKARVVANEKLIETRECAPNGERWVTPSIPPG
jgi:hypothetical protein